MADEYDDDTPVVYTDNIVSDNEADEDVSSKNDDAEPENSSKHDDAETEKVGKKDDEDVPELNPKKRKIDTNSDVVATHYNKLEEKGLDERAKSRIFFMRNFNNWIKSVLINEFITKTKSGLKLGEPLRVLDMCCGKGGDLLKWDKGGITHLICTDIAEVSIQQCEERYRAMVERKQGNKFGKLFTAEFFACDSTLQRLREKYKDPSIELNLVSCQFAFHYCFESLKQAECMIRNASECLRPGGYFIGTIPDANDIMKRQREADSNSFGNSIYRINFLCDTDTPPLFGAKYNFELDGVVNCPEFLVHFPLLIKLARKFGLRLVLKERFEDFFDRNRDSGRYCIHYVVNVP